VRKLWAGAVAALAFPLATVIPVKPAQADPAQAEEAGGSPKVVLVVDISGSMDEKDDAGTVKIEGAKRALLGVLQGLSPATLVGLHPYPSDGNCGPGTTADGLEAGSEQLRAAITGLVAGGNTPTGPALRAAADRILSLGGGATIVLVSDGESNCGGDPCEVARQVAAEGVGITVNTVGFKISPQGADELKCVAEATGGHYFYAADTDRLTTSIADAATPRLSIVVDQPRSGDVLGAGSVVTVKASVTNVSNHRLDDVRTLLAFPHDKPGNLDPGVAGAIKYLGNLAPNETRDVQWQYRVARSQDGGQSTIVVHATAKNAAPQTVTAQFSYGDALSLASAGPLLRNASRVAILGDSYSSGEGAGDYYPETNIARVNTCHRTDNTYAMSLWPRKPLLLACSGATTDNIVGPNRANNEPAQILRLAAEQQKEPIDLVLLTIGGNDIGFANIVETCVVWSQCHMIRIPVGADKDRIRACMDAQFDVVTLVINQVRGRSGLEVCDPAVTFRQLVLYSIDGVTEKLSRAYRAIDATVNSAEALASRNGKVAPIIVLAYPNLMPYRAGSSSQGFCSRFLSEQEVQFGSEVVDKLNATIKSVVLEERAAGLPIYFADDTAEALRPNHTICDAEPHAVREVLWRSASGLLDGLVGPAFRMLTGGPAQEQLHPNKDGYRDVTAELVRWSNTPAAREPVQRNRPAPSTSVPLGPYVGSLDLTADPGSATLLQPASTVTLQGGGFAPGTSAHIIVRSTPTLIGAALVNDDGRIDADVTIPPNLAPGDHLIVVTGVDVNGRPYQLYAAIEVRRPVSWATIALWATSGLLVLLTAPLVVSRLRQRARPAPPAPSPGA